MFWMKIVQGRDLPVADLNGFSDPYVEVKVLGHHRTIYRTQVVKRNLNPFWNEEFTYQPSSISEVLKLNCWDKDTFSRDDFLGYCTVPLQMYANRGLVDEWLPLLDKRGRRRRGDIHIQVTYQADQSVYPTNFAATSAPRSSPASIFVAPPLTEEEMMREDPRFAFKRRLRMMQNPDEFARPDYPGSQPAMMPPAPEMPSLRELFGLSGASRPPSGGRPLGVANPNYDPYPDFQPHPLSDITRREITPEDYDLLLTLDDNVSRASTNSSSPASSATPSASTSPTATTYSAPSAASMSRVNPTATPTTSYSSYSTSPTSASSYPSSSSYSTYNRTQNPMTYSTSPVHSSESTASSSTSTGATAPTASAAPNQCKICYDHTVDCVLIPCGHAGMCYDCANIQRSTNGNCPFCRAPINNVVKQFPV